MPIAVQKECVELNIPSGILALRMPQHVRNRGRVILLPDTEHLIG